ncbi:MAG: sodium:proton antiporter [Bacteroidales bacterium]|nr:sodium:proton antiporter [Bacteroidales bacterium]MDZ4205294.1 sodium:proton antiporter [Bacteroidales bacterium]
METIHLIALLPFIILLLLIAVMPLTISRLWENNLHKFIVSVVLSIPVVIYLAAGGHGSVLADHILFDYIPFIIMLGALFIISGGIYISSSVSGRPGANLTFLAVGAILASFMGTTGASMLLIRPLLRANDKRKHKVHIVMFFLAIVANTGGLLTPLGDPALFILYLRGVPFHWFAQLAPEWLFVNGLLLLMFYAIDKLYYHKQYPTAGSRCRYTGFPFKLRGTLNILWITGVVLAVALINEYHIPEIKNQPYLAYFRELIILMMAGLSLGFTSKRNLMRNAFSWGPIFEVAALFLGIFITMTPALIYLEQNVDLLRVTSPAEFYFATGFLSSILDNTPTAVAFHSMAGIVTAHAAATASSLVSGVSPNLLKAVSLGAVLFGSMTYIGNGPNFMVKSIAENRGIKMPGFFGYIFRFSLLVLLPVFILVWLLFL